MGMSLSMHAGLAIVDIVGGGETEHDIPQKFRIVAIYILRD